eukprot:scaffold56609_cov16-Tisochrysis_lutea.AAC.2
MSDVFSQNWETLAAGAARPSSPSGSRHVPDSSTGVRPKESSSAGATPTSGSSEGVPPAGRSRAQGGIDAQRSTHDNIRPDIPISAEDQEALASVSGVQVNSSSGSSSISSVPGSTGDRLPAVSEDAPSSFNGSNSRSSSSSDSSAPAGSLHGPVSGNPAPDSSTTSFHAKDPRNWPIRIPKPLIPVRPTLIRPEAAQRAPTGGYVVTHHDPVGFLGPKRVEEQDMMILHAQSLCPPCPVIVPSRYCMPNHCVLIRPEEAPRTIARTSRGSVESNAQSDRHIFFFDAMFVICACLGPEQDEWRTSKGSVGNNAEKAAELSPACLVSLTRSLG